MNIIKETNGARFVSYVDWADKENDTTDMTVYREGRPVHVRKWEGKALIAIFNEDDINKWLKFGELN